ncbi:hypothetical protein Acr_18g0006310 [Actinidia rufa]|uniref:Putative plant transposon protein domain-containing protein n=1 Tax=Actinidia rufa TaxID=165716 RepID=A0A7J0G6Q3_9ERIC|nr:hypothetical protein Acr_18g0006310 [Actinidia rufa]
MARFLVESNPISSTSLWDLLLAIVLIAILFGMVTKRAAKKRAKGSEEGTSRAEGNLESEKDKTQEVKYKKAQAKKKQEAWHTSLLARGVTCERQVLREQIDNPGVIRILSNRGLSFFFEQVDGYYRSVVIEFYKYMKISSSGNKITRKVRGIDVAVTPNIIASYLSYVRPTARNVQYLHKDFPSLFDVQYAEAIYENPEEFVAGEKLRLGKFKAEYKLMTKVIHYNLSLRGSKKLLKLAEAEFLYVMMNPAIVVDFAQYIWNEMAAFKEHPPKNANLPFVKMVTSLCASTGVPFWVDKIAKPPVGPLTIGSVNKSRAMSRASTSESIPQNAA